MLVLHFSGILFTIISFLVIRRVFWKTITQNATGTQIFFLMPFMTYGGYILAIAFLKVPSLFSIITVSLFIFLLFMTYFVCKCFNKKRISILACLLLACLWLFQQDQKNLQKIIPDKKIETAKNFEFPNMTTTIIDMSSPTFVSNNKEVLKDISFKDLYLSNGKQIICSGTFREIAIVTKNELLCYTNIAYDNLIPRNATLGKFLFQNSIFLGMTVDDENIPYFKYALAKKDGLWRNYYIDKYVLYNALNGELEYFSELPDFAQ